MTSVCSMDVYISISDSVSVNSYLHTVLQHMSHEVKP